MSQKTFSQKELSLSELRESLKLTQKKMAEKLNVTQANISKLEQSPDLRVSSLKGMVEIMGGQLRLIAHFKEGSVHLRIGKD